MRALIRLLQGYQAKYGPAAQIAVPSCKLEHVNELGPTCREEIYIQRDSISTVLTSHGDEVEW